ncbi:MAG TPA: response regulator transcription factor [Actinomycetota bacterium]|nr:response regulator transcription factor [Actinomycetota bacterium]
MSTGWHEVVGKITPDKVIRVGVAEDHPLARESLVQLLESAEDILIVGEAADGEEALELADSVGEPDILLVDLRLPGIDGLEVTRRLSDEHPDVRVIILTTNEDPAYATEAMKAGAKAYVLKSADGEEVLETVRMVAHGHAVLDRDVWDVLAEQRRTRAEQFGLTAREMDVLGLLGRGYRNREIAESLGLSQSTVKTHVARIFKRLDVSDRTDAVITAFRLGIIE